MKIASIGGGPAGLYFAILMKQADPAHEVEVYERNRPDDTFGFGVVFSDATLGKLASADPTTYQAITKEFAHWDDIDIHFGGEVIRSSGHGFCGLSRHKLLEILQARCRDLGVLLHFEHEVESVDELGEVDLVLAADGVGSAVRETYADYFKPDIDTRPNKFVWFGTTVPFSAFTFFFKSNAHGLWRVHAYRYSSEGSTFIVECTAETWLAAGMQDADEDDTIEYLQELFADELAGHRLIKNRSIWRNFPTIRNGSWHHGNIVLVGDAVHTAHFSIGSGTKLAMEDAIALRDAIAATADVATALEHYENRRRPSVERLQRAAQVSLEWFENTERYRDFAPWQFSFSLLTRSLRVSHENLRQRDPALVQQVDEALMRSTGGVVGEPPRRSPLAVGGLRLPCRTIALATSEPGDAGLVIVGAAAVAADGRFDAADKTISSSADLVHWVKQRERNAPEQYAGIRLVHAGPRSKVAEVPVAASELRYGPELAQARALTATEIDATVVEFTAAARLARDAGYHWLELDFAHGSLVGSFLSPATNRRSDDHGGNWTSRSALARAIVREVSAVWAGQGALAVRMAACDWIEGGVNENDVTATARSFVDLGANAIVVANGHILARALPPQDTLADTPFLDMMRNGAGVVTVAEGVAMDEDLENTLIAAGRADLCVRSI